MKRRSEIQSNLTILAETDRKVTEFGVTHPLISINKDLTEGSNPVPVIWLNFEDVKSYPLRFATPLARDIAFLHLIHAPQGHTLEFDYKEYFEVHQQQFLQNIAASLKKRSYQTLIKQKFPNWKYEEPMHGHDYNLYKGRRILTEDEIVFVFSGQRPEQFRFKDTVVKPVLATILGKDETLPYVPTHLLHHNLFKNLKVKI